MNTETNELFLEQFLTPEQRQAIKDDKVRMADLTSRIASALAGPVIQEVPEHLSRAARRALGKADHVTISKTSGGKLSRWAAQQRKARRKAAKQARKRNR